MRKETDSLMRLVCVVVMVMVMAAAVGCGTKPNPASCADNHCSDPDLPFCDVDGSIGGEPNMCIAVACTPGEFEMCRGDRALTCNNNGDNYELVDCEYGCSADAKGCKACDTPDCEEHIIPKYLPTTCNQLTTTGALSVTTSTTFDTTNALNCSSVVTQIDGPDICVLRHSSIVVERNQTLTVTGTRALALVADRDVKIDGVLDARARTDVGNVGGNGPGGGTRKSGTTSTLAGGGAGYRTAGGHGGTTVAGGAQNGGTAGQHPMASTVLLGGSQPEVTGNGAAPGGGGGAIVIISCRGTVSVPGVIDVNGGGGGRGRFVAAQYTLPSGGGTGGTVVLQGMSVVVTGELFANGGGGGGGGFDSTSGSAGLRSTQAAPGGAGSSDGAGPGGIGGSATFVAGPGGGSGPSGDVAAGGAGGGSAGYLLTYTPQGVTPTLTPFTVSPTFETNGTIPTN